ncbi:MAG: hypothetical protein QNJ81_08215 [Acidimicrobiia bacterium]|nr:hypothetical protein [Acidimicrobiia bacterium]
MKIRAMVLLLAFGLVASACGGSESADGGIATLEAEDAVAAAAGQAEGSGTDEVDTEQAMLNLAACLRDEGIDIEDPTVDAEGNVEFGGFRGQTDGDGAPIDRETIQAAMEACEDEIEGVVLGFGDGGFDLTELQDTLVEYAGCMRDNGYDMDDPDLSAFGPGAGGEPGEGSGRPFGEIDQDDPDFVVANEVCAEILGGVPGVGGRGLGRAGG